MVTIKLKLAKFVPDITTNRWVLIAEGRSKRPVDLKEPGSVPANKTCIFCPGMEKVPGEELFRIGPGAPYEAGWKVRVIKNKYPITDFHEVIIHSPDDSLDIDKLPIGHVGLILETYRERYRANKGNGHVIIFNNVGEAAGASISHPHSQLVVVPNQINLDILKQEPIVNVVVDNTNFVVYCPEFSQWPFELWIAPKKKGEDFGQTSDEALADLAKVLQDSLKRLLMHLSAGDPGHFHPGLPMVAFKGAPAYNFYIHHDKDWYIRIIPRLVHRAGFELGTGLSVNPVDPSDAAEILKTEVTA